MINRKILLTIGDISLKGGAERVCVNLANALARIPNYEVEILSFYQSNSTLSYSLESSVKLNVFYTFDEMNHRKFNGFFGNFKKIYYKNLHKILLSLKLKFLYKNISAVITNDWIFFPYFKNKNTTYIKILHLTQGRFARRNSFFDTLIYLSCKEANKWHSYHPNIKIIPNFLPSIPTQNASLSQKIILSVGRMDSGDQKGFFRLIDIWNLIQKEINKISNNLESKNLNYQNNIESTTLVSQTFKVSQSIEFLQKLNELKLWKLHIVGDGILKDKLQEKIKDLDLESSITIKPFTKEIEKEYLQSSIYVMTSFFEGFGMVLVEASSFAIPCIAFDVNTGPSDIIEHNKSGYLIKDNDLNSFANKLKDLMLDETLRKQMGLKAKDLVSTRFSKESVMPLWEEVLRKNVL